MVTGHELDLHYVIKKGRAVGFKEMRKKSRVSGDQGENASQVRSGNKKVSLLKSRHAIVISKFSLGEQYMAVKIQGPYVPGLGLQR